MRMPAFDWAPRELEAPTVVYTKCPVVGIEGYLSKPEFPEGFLNPLRIISEAEKDHHKKQLLEQARVRFANKYHADDGDTIKTLRMRLGLSQQALAEKIGTSQPAIARIEHGAEMHLGTARRLADALGVDMNVLDTAVQRQIDIDHSSRTSNDE